MKVFHSPNSLLHAPSTYFRRGKAIPHLEQPARYNLLLAATHVSIHAGPSNFMAYYAGYGDETGEHSGLGYNLNLPLLAGRRGIMPHHA